MYFQYHKSTLIVDSATGNVFGVEQLLVLEEPENEADKRYWKPYIHDQALLTPIDMELLKPKLDVANGGWAFDYYQVPVLKVPDDEWAPLYSEYMLAQLEK